jgi:hypothetical protein
VCSRSFIESAWWSVGALRNTTPDWFANTIVNHRRFGLGTGWLRGELAEGYRTLCLPSVLRGSMARK